MNLQDIASALKSARAEARKRFLHMGVGSPQEALLLLAFCSLSNCILSVSVLLPFTYRSMTIHRFLGTPLLAHTLNSSSPSLWVPSPLYDLIAIADRSTNYVLLQNSDLRQCLTIQNTYMCADIVTHLRWSDSCLGALYAADAPAICLRCSQRVS